MEVERLDWKNIKFLIHILYTYTKTSHTRQTFIVRSNEYSLLVPVPNEDSWKYQNLFVCISILYKTERIFDLALVNSV